MVLNNLQPNLVFKYFEEICSIPHGSGNVKKISDYLVKFATDNNLKYRQDESLNVIIWKDASKGYESAPGVIMQGHIDMVAVKEDNCTKDLTNEGLDVCVDGDYIYAKQTSLGGDDGIAVAYMMAALTDTELEHPELTCIFTVDEEIGMLGAAAIDLSDVDARIMLNIDSEDEGIFLAGCAGGATVKAALPALTEKISGVRVKLSITGLMGGHSGIEIIAQRANANILMGRLLHEISNEVTFGIEKLSGGEKDNAIAKFCNATIIVEKEDLELLKNTVEKCNQVIKHEYANTDPDLTISLTTGDNAENVLSLTQSSITRVVTALMFMPSGILRMSTDIKGLVQTSLNLGVLSMNEDCVELCYSVRSSVKSEKEYLIERIKCLCEFLGGECSVYGSYPAWEFDKDSKIRKIMCDIYKDMYGKEAKVETIHAGVECGLMSEKLTGLDCISYGPDMVGIHTTGEKLSIASVQRTWELTAKVLKAIK